MLSADKFYEIQQDFFGRNRDAMIPGLERIKAAVEEYGNPQLNCKVVHVAGTNAKGSTSTMIAAGLQAAGFKVGLFTSPHIHHFSERFRINGKMVSAKNWLSIYSDIIPICEKHNLTFFEITTFIAFVLFSQEKCDWVVLETGMGGRLDATNVCLPELSVITTIGMDHIEHLGNTIEKIAGEKLGIVKPNIDLVISAANEQSVIDLAYKKCEETGSKCTVSDLSRVKSAENDKNPREICLDGRKNYTLAMGGDFQKINFTLALTALEKLGFGDKEEVIAAIAGTIIPARMQNFEIEGKTLIFDVAHNPQAMEKLIASVKKENYKKPLSVILGMMSDKDSNETIKHIIGEADKIFCFTPTTKRAKPADYLSQDFKDLGEENVFVCKLANEALKRAIQESETILVCGSFWTVSEVMAAAGIEIS